VIIRSFDVGFGSPLRTEVSWFTAAIIAGLPVWLLPWRQEQNRALETSPEGASGVDHRTMDSLNLCNREAVCSVYKFKARADTSHKIDGLEILARSCEPIAERRTS